MPSKPRLIVLTQSTKDEILFAKLENEFQVDFMPIFGSEKALAQVMIQNKNSLILLDADGFSDVAKSDERAALSHFLHDTVQQRRVFLLSEKRLSAYAEVFEGPVFFQHSIVRHEYVDSEALIAMVLQRALEEHPLGLRNYFPEGAEGQKLQLKRAAHRAAAVEAVQSFFVKKGINARISGNVAQAVDELLMNSIFNAPYSSHGVATRKGISRTADFDLGKNGAVDLEILSCDTYVGVCVSDRFGTLQTGTLMRILGIDYIEEGYKPKAFMPNAGIGLRGIIDLGLNLVITCKPGSRTDAMIFFPKVKSFSRATKVAQIIGYFGGLSVKNLSI